MSRRSGFTMLVCVAVAILGPGIVACSKTADVSEIFMALDPVGDRRRTVFFTDTKSINCVAEVGISRPGVTLEFVIRQIQRYDFSDRTFKEADRVISQAEQTPGRNQGGPTKQALTFDKLGPDGRRSAEGPYPAGRYICELRLDGVLEGSTIFNVDFPPCPTAQIVQGSVCYGFYEEDRSCPAFGSSTNPDLSCACTKDKGWACP